jgi:pterin-4a-carbinolamine dehydratase
MSQSSISSNPQQTRLKAERIQEAVAIAIDPKGVNRLKAERIQLGIQGLPGWTLQRGGIVRTIELADNRAAWQLLQGLTGLGIDGEMPEVHVYRGRVTFVLPTVDDAFLEEPLFEMAKVLAETGA